MARVLRSCVSLDKKQISYYNNYIQYIAEGENLMYAMELPFDFKPIAKRVTQGEKVLISCPKNENLVDLVLMTENEYNELEEYRRKEEKQQAGARFLENMKAMQAEAIKNGTSEMTMEEIDEIIAESRRERRGKQ